MPDLNSLPPSSRCPEAPSPSPTPSPFPSQSSSESPSSGASMPSPTQQLPDPPSPTPARATSISLQAAASVNAGLQHQHDTRRSSSSLSRQTSLSRRTPSSNHTRHQSQVLMNLQLNDPTMPGPGEMVNEHPILTRHSSSSIPHSSTSPFLVTSGGDPHHQRSPSLGELHQEMEAEQEATVNRLLHQIRDQREHIRQLQLDQSSAIVEEVAPAETAFYQAETSMLVRENQMLRHRVRELERQLESLNREVPKEEGAAEH